MITFFGHALAAQLNGAEGILIKKKETNGRAKKEPGTPNQNILVNIGRRTVVGSGAIHFRLPNPRRRGSLSSSAKK